MTERHSIRVSLCKLLTPRSGHVGTISHEFCLVLLEFGVLYEALMLSEPALLEAAEDEYGSPNTQDTADGSNDGDLGS